MTLCPQPKRSQKPILTQEDQEDAEYEFDLYFHSLHKDHFSEEGRKLFGKHLATRNRQWLYDGEVWVHLTNEEQKVRTESYREFYCAIVGREVPKYKPQPLRLCSLLTLRRKYKRSLAYLWNKLFHKDRLIICSNENSRMSLMCIMNFLRSLTMMIIRHGEGHISDGSKKDEQ